MSRTFVALSLALVALSTAAEAQQKSDTLVPGRRIRIHQHQGAPVQGALVALGDSVVTLRTSETDTVAVARSAIAKVEVYEGTHSNAGKGALTGLIIGGLTGAVVGAVSASATQGSLIEYSAGEGAAAYGISLGLLGAGIGALVGSGSHTEKWSPATLPPVLPTVTILPDESKGRRVALGLRISF